MKTISREIAAAVLCGAVGMTGVSHAEKPNMTFGALSDIHITDAKSTEMFRRALKWMDGRRADGVLLCGDIAERGKISELELAGKTWFEVFPGNRRSDGGHIEKLFHYGDHDGYPVKEVYAERAANWKRAFGEEWSPLMVKRVKGYLFVLANFDGKWGSDTPPLGGLLAELKPDGVRPFFVSQHRMYKNTCMGEHSWGQDVGRVTKVLSGYPSCIAFCGHGHYSATDERIIWQGAFTVLGVPSLSYLHQMPGRENGYNGDDGRPRNTWGPKTFSPERQMRDEMRLGKDDHQGYFVSVYDDRVVVERIDLFHETKVGPDWTIPVGKDAPRPYSHTLRAATDPAPEFPEGAKAECVMTNGTDRVGNPSDQYVVSFPVANSTADTPRALDYEVTAEISKGDVTRICCQKRVYSPKSYLSEGHDRGPARCVFAKSEIQSDRDALRFRVRPVNAFGRKGREIVTEDLGRWDR